MVVTLVVALVAVVSFAVLLFFAGGNAERGP
jgi:hypothetical protein